MGQTSSSRRGSSPSRERYLSAQTSRTSDNNNGESEQTGSSLFSSYNMSAQALSDVSVPFQNWLSMDAKLREKHVLHAKHCILTPYFCFSKDDEYSGKVVAWLQQKQLIPKQSNVKMLSDKHIIVADCAEEALDMILSLMTSSCFLYDVFHLAEQTKECHLLSDALTIAKNCKLIDVLLWNTSQLVSGNNLPRDDTALIILVLLNQAMDHIQEFGVLSDAFEQRVKDNSERCDALKLKGNGLFNTKKYDKACVFYTQAIQLRPFDAVLYGNRAQSYLSAAKYREALSDARRAICLNPSWEKGYFRYAKAYFHLGFPDKAIAINLQAQKKCQQTSELIQQIAMFTKGRSSSPSSQPTYKRQCVTSVERPGLTTPDDKDDDSDEYMDLPELIDDDGEDLAKLFPPSENHIFDYPSSMDLDDSFNGKQQECSCSPCKPRSTITTRKKRACDVMCDHHHHHDVNDGDNNQKDKKALSKRGKEKANNKSVLSSSEACSSASIHRHHMCDDSDDNNMHYTLSWTNNGTNSLFNVSSDVTHSYSTSTNHYHVCDDDDDSCRDCKCLVKDNVDAKTKPKMTSSKSGSLSDLHHNCDADDKVCSDCCLLEYDCKNKHNAKSNFKPSNSQSSNQYDDASDEKDDDEIECVCGMCSLNGDDDDDDDDDEWEDVGDDDDSDAIEIDVDDDDDDDDDDDEEDEDDIDDDEEDEEAYLFNPFFPMLESMSPSPPTPSQLFFGSEILLLALIRQFIENHSEFQSEDTPPGALPEVIESLTTKKVTKELIESCSSCCICQSDYDLNETVTCLPCNHVYHGPCITTWLKMHATCPTCRDVLPH